MKAKLVKFILLFFIVLLGRALRAQVSVKILTPGGHVTPYELRAGNQSFTADINGIARFTTRQFQALKDEQVSFRLKDSTIRGFYLGNELYGGDVNDSVLKNEYIVFLFNLTLQQLIDKKRPVFYLIMSQFNEIEIALPGGH